MDKKYAKHLKLDKNICSNRKFEVGIQRKKSSGMVKPASSNTRGDKTRKTSSNHAYMFARNAPKTLAGTSKPPPRSTRTRPEDPPESPPARHETERSDNNRIPRPTQVIQKSGSKFKTRPNRENNASNFPRKKNRNRAAGGRGNTRSPPLSQPDPEPRRRFLQCGHGRARCSWRPRGGAEEEEGWRSAR